MPYENVKLFAVWEPDTFTVNYNSNGGTGQLSRAEVRYGDSVPLPKDVSIYRDGLFLTGWAKTDNAKSTLKSLTMPAENLTLYAVWSKKPPTAKITLHYDDKVQVIEVEIGSTLDMLDDFGVTKDGEIVSGWYFENSPVRVENLDVSEDCDLYAKWQSATYITISIDRSYLNKADIEYKMPLDMTGYAKLTLPVVDDKNDIYNSIFGCTYGYSTKSRTEISARSNITAALKASSAKAPSSIVFLTNTAAVRERLKIRISSAITTSSCGFPNRAQRDISYRRQILRFRGIRTEILSARRKSPAVTKTNPTIILCTTGRVIL